MQRIFAETTEFPLEFRNWLKRFIIDEVKQEAIDSGGGPGDSSGFNPAVWMPGIILPLAFGSTPTYSLLCDGREVSRLTYAKLFAAIHETWGAGDGTTTFNLPDLRDRSLYGHGTTVVMAKTDLGALGTRGPKHSHSFSGGGTNSAGSHSHGGSVGGGGHSHTGSANMAGDHAHGPSVDNGFATSQGTTAALGTGGSVRYIVSGSAPVTSVDGLHSHTITISGDGGHGHTISSDGNHVHTVTGSISGGGVLDTPAYAGVHYVITTGAIS